VITVRHVFGLRGMDIHDITVGTPAGNDLTMDLDGALAFPGLVNSHDHLEFDSYPQLDGGPYQDYVEWAADLHRRHAQTIARVEAIPRAQRVRAGIIRNLLCGVTCVAHHGEEPDSPDSPIGIVQGTRTIHSPRLGSLRGMLSPDRRPVVLHIGEGIGVDAGREVDRFLRWNIWRKSLIGVHAIALRPDQARRFSAIVWCPMSNEFLYGRTAAVSAFKTATTLLFGTDSTLTAPWNIWDHIRRARQLGELTDEELIAALTTAPGRIWKLSASDDLVIARKRHSSPLESFFAINPQDILLVIKGGKVVLVDESVCAQLPGVEFLPVAMNGVEKMTVLVS
jgi:cytosine/adenosine deaminase-related metal-dependent hydrolase